jgi:hypothetical protein
MPDRISNFFLYIALAMLFVVGAFLRFDNLSYGMEDEMARPDERIHHDYALHLFAKITDRFDYPIPDYGQNWGPNFIGFNTVLFCALHPELVFHHSGEEELEEIARQIHEPFYFILAMRTASAIFSSLSLLVVFLISKAIFGSVAGLFTVALCAFSPLMITEAKSAKEDSLLLFVFLLSLYFFSRYISSKSKVSLRLGCFLSGFTFGVKIIGVLIVPFYCISFFNEAFKKYRATGFGHSFFSMVGRLETLVLYFSAGYLFLNFYFLLSPITVFRTFLKMKSTFGPQESQIGGAYFILFEVLPYAAGWAVFLAAIVGSFYFLKKRNWIVLSLISISIILIGLLHKSPIVFDRYALVLIPIVAIVGIGFVFEITSKTGSLLRLGLLFIVLLTSLWQIVPTSLATNNLLGQSSTRKIAGDYLRKNIMEGESVLILRYNFWLGQGPMYGLNSVYRDWFDEPKWIAKAQHVVPFDNVRFLSCDKIGDNKPTWVLAEYTPDGSMSLFPDQVNKAKKLLAHDYKEVFIATPAKAVEHVKFNSWALPLAGFQYAQAYGPQIKIFRRVGPTN